MTTATRRPHYWELWSTELPPGQELSAMRRAIDKAPGAAPELWRHYTTLHEDGRLSARLRAEHLTMSLFGIHQQSQSRSMHWQNVRLGEALRRLRGSGRYSEAAVTARVVQMATSSSLDELVHHIRPLIDMLTTLKPAPQGLDYTSLYRDLVDWQSSDAQRRGRVLRRWAADFHRDSPTSDKTRPTP